MKQRRHDGMATVDGPLWAWGNNGWGQLGDGSKESRTTPVETDLPEDLVAIEAATNTVHAICSDGTILAWGHNPFGQLGDGTTTASAFPVTVKNLRGVTSIAAGDFVLAVKSDGTVWAWGRNDGYQLGNGTTTSATTPVKVPGLRNVTAVAVGIATGYALQSDGSV